MDRLGRALRLLGLNSGTAGDTARRIADSLAGRQRVTRVALGLVLRTPRVDEILHGTAPAPAKAAWAAVAATENPQQWLDKLEAFAEYVADVPLTLGARLARARAYADALTPLQFVDHPDPASAALDAVEQCGERCGDVLHTSEVCPVCRELIRYIESTLRVLRLERVAAHV
jgi:hypothetical protein